VAPVLLASLAARGGARRAARAAHAGAQAEEILAPSVSPACAAVADQPVAGAYAQRPDVRAWIATTSPRLRAASRAR
jgi:hypothetical protein